MFTRFDTNKSTKGASKLRRDLINAEIANLRDLLPLPQSTRQRLSQLQLMALVCVYVRKANYFQQVFKRYDIGLHQAPTPNIGFSKALTGFLMMLTQNGKLLYISDNAAEYLGHSMEDLLIHGDSVYDIIDKQDHGSIQAELGRSVPQQTSSHHHNSSQSILDGEQRMFLCRMNVSRNARRQMRFGDQKVVLVQGHYLSFLPLCSRNEPVFLATCTPIAMPETRECVVQGATNVFTTIHSMDMKIVHIDKNGEFHLGFKRNELQGLSWYQLLHWDSMREAQNKHRLITQSEQDRSCILLVRMQRRQSDFIWVHVVLQVRDGQDSNQQPVIVCTNQVLSEREAYVMLANEWLYHYYSVQSKIQFGIPFEGATRIPPNTSYYHHPHPHSHPHHGHPHPHHPHHHSPTIQTHPYAPPPHHVSYGYHSPVGIPPQGSPSLIGHHHNGTASHISNHNSSSTSNGSGSTINSNSNFNASNNSNNSSQNQQQHNHHNNHHHQHHHSAAGGEHYKSPYAPYRIDSATQPVDYSQPHTAQPSQSQLDLKFNNNNNNNNSNTTNNNNNNSNSHNTNRRNNHNNSNTNNSSSNNSIGPPSSKKRAISKLEPLFIPDNSQESPENSLAELQIPQPQMHENGGDDGTNGNGGPTVILSTVISSRHRLLSKAPPADPPDFMEQWNPSPPWSDTAQKVPDISHQELSPYLTTTPPTPTSAPSLINAPTFCFDWMPEQFVPIMDCPPCVPCLTQDGLSLPMPVPIQIPHWPTDHRLMHLQSSERRIDDENNDSREQRRSH